MSAIPQRSKWTVEDYLAFERESEEKHEFLDGEIFAMAGASLSHNRIVRNLNTTIHTQLRNSPCEVFPSDLRLKISATGLYTYPDIMVVCGEPQLEDTPTDTLLNPTLIIEVLSPSTEAYDRGKKFEHYRTLESFREYILIAQDRFHVEPYVRQADNQWLLSDYNKPDDVINLSSIDCTLLVGDIYEKVTFEEEV
jgi:Uma2 family endonuclease